MPGSEIKLPPQLSLRAQCSSYKRFIWMILLKKKMKIQGSLGDAIFEVLGKKSSVPIAHILTWLHDSFLTCKILLRALSASAWASLSLQPCPRQSNPIPQPARPTKCVLAPKLFVRSPDLDSSPLLSLGWGKHPCWAGPSLRAQQPAGAFSGISSRSDIVYGGGGMNADTTNVSGVNLGSLQFIEKACLYF